MAQLHIYYNLLLMDWGITPRTSCVMPCYMVKDEEEANLVEVDIHVEAWKDNVQVMTQIDPT